MRDDPASNSSPRDVLLDVRGLKKHFSVKRGPFSTGPREPIKAVDDVSFTIREGETLALVGESGCGKTTLGRCVLQLERPTEGRIFFRGADITDAPPAEMRRLRREMQVIFQDPYSSINPRMTTGRIVGEPLAIHGLCGSRAERRHRVDQLLVDVGLTPDMAKRYPHEFSGGQRQRIVIARALAVGPSLIVCDEPVSALDVSIQAQVMNLLQRLRAEKQLTYLFISHDLSVVRHFADRVAVMYLGHLVELADRDELFRNPLHPYTQALLSAIPVPDPVKEATRTRIALRGGVPSASNKPAGCVFHPRCLEMREECTAALPPLEEVSPGHWVACVRVDSWLPAPRLALA